MGGEGLARPKVTRKFVVGLFCGGVFHDVAFTRVDGCNVVRLYDWELRMRKVVARSFFPEEGVVRDMDIRAKNDGVLEADIGSAVPAGGWLHLNAGLRGFLARMAARQTDDRIQRACASTSPRSSLWYGGCVRSTGRCHGSLRTWYIPSSLAH